MSSPAVPISPVSFITPFIVGLIISLIQYGISVSQVYLYIFTSESDSKVLRYLILLVFICETIQTVITGRVVIYYTVLAFEDIDRLFHIDWSITIWLLLMVPIIAVTQGFYLRRIWLLSRKSKILLSTGILLLLVRLAFHTAASIYTGIRPEWSHLANDFIIKFCIELANSASIVVDGFLALTMVYYLYRSRSDFDQTESIVRWIMAYTVNTGLFTMIAAIVIVVTFALVKNNLLYGGLIAVEARVYSNSLFGALNARPSFRAKLPSNVYEVNTSYELTQLGITRCIPRIEVFQETLAEQTDADSVTGETTGKNTELKLEPTESSMGNQKRA